jgi:hypothetical protein
MVCCEPKMKLIKRQEIERNINNNRFKINRLPKCLVSYSLTVQFELRKSLHSLKLQFYLQVCMKMSRKFSLFTMNIGHFTIIENYVMTSTEEIIHFIANVTIVGRTKGHKKTIILLGGGGGNCVTICIFVNCFYSGDQHIISLFFLDLDAIIF